MNHERNIGEKRGIEIGEKRAVIQKKMGERFTRMWDLYLQACAASFESGNIDVMQFLLTKGPSGKNLPLTRKYMYQD